MELRNSRYQRGQSMSEFVVAMTVLLPLVLGVIYIGKYADIKHEAIQASRYAAFERALDPSPSNEPPAMLAEETKARFLTDGSRNGGRIGYQDTTAGLATSGTLNPVWSQLNGAPMLSSYADVSVQVTPGPINSRALSLVEKPGQAFFNLNGNGQIQANVQVAPSNIAHFGPLSHIDLRIAATTVVAGDSWNSGGAQDVASHFTPQDSLLSFPGRYALRPLGWVLWPLDHLFSDSSPQFGCLRPDVVPASRTTPLAPYNPGDRCY